MLLSGHDLQLRQRVGWLTLSWMRDLFHFFQYSLRFLQAFPKSLSCASQARFHRVLAESQYSRNFGHADFLDVLQDQHFAVLRLQLGQSSAEFLITRGLTRCLFID